MKYLSVCVFSLAFAACAGLSREQSHSWLNSMAGPSGINMTGKWDAGGAFRGGWGEANLIQDGRRFSGSMGMYYVDGVVNGDDVYMVISSGGKVYNTARLKRMPDGSITGKTVAGALIDGPGAETAQVYLISLKRM